MSLDRLLLAVNWQLCIASLMLLTSHATVGIRSDSAAQGFET